MYFAILGKHPQISLAELDIVKPHFFPSTKKGIVLFETETPELLSTLGGCIKSGVVVPEKELQEILKDVKIIGVQEESIGKHFKKTIGVRRFKKVKLDHTDREIKEKGKEIINLDNGKYGVVEQYQNIPLYEIIDFEKPSRSMTMGMMPAKLTHILINLALNNEHSTQNITIYDPFCGSGTTNFLANALGYDTIGSDLKIQYAQENAKRRSEHTYHNSSKSLQFFQQDITKPLELPNTNQTNIIVTEGRLGPIISRTSRPNDVKEAQQQIQKLYEQFIKTVINSDVSSSIVFTIPQYIGHQNTHEQFLQSITEKLGYQRKSIDEIYQRPDQQVGRKICILKKRK